MGARGRGARWHRGGRGNGVLPSPSKRLRAFARSGRDSRPPRRRGGHVRRLHEPDAAPRRRLPRLRSPRGDGRRRDPRRPAGGRGKADPRSGDRSERRGRDRGVRGASGAAAAGRLTSRTRSSLSPGPAASSPFGDAAARPCRDLLSTRASSSRDPSNSVGRVPRLSCRRLLAGVANSPVEPRRSLPVSLGDLSCLERCFDPSPPMAPSPRLAESVPLARASRSSNCSS